MRRARYKFFLLPLFFMLACIACIAQANSEIDGIVTDQTGAAIPNVHIILTDPATRTVHTAESSSTGLYALPGLNPATYNLKATAQGFQAYVQNCLVLNISATLRADIKLNIGAETQVV